MDKMPDPNPFIAARKDGESVVITLPAQMAGPLSSACHRFDGNCTYPSEGVALNAVHQALKWLGYPGQL